MQHYENAAMPKRDVQMQSGMQGNTELWKSLPKSQVLFEHVGH